MDKLIAREKEVYELERLYASDRSELVIVYGRRRIGKTFLVNQVFADRFTFTFVGARNERQAVQLQRFSLQLQQFSGSPFVPKLNTWDDAFDQLRQLITSRPKEERKVIFFDEMPWVDTPRSSFVSSLEYFWNAWAAQRDDIMFIACGSATSWMVDRLVRNRGGLYNRVTGHIYLRPFALGECEQYLHQHRCMWDRYTILQCYMVLGGVPFYLSMLRPQESLAQNIDRLFFEKNAPLRNEFEQLYSALFTHADSYIAVAEALSSRHEGMTRTMIAEATGVQGSSLTKILDNLERCDFIVTYANYKSKSRNTMYRMADPYTLFYFKFIADDKQKDEHFWTHHIASPAISAWQGFSFETVCLSHLQQIKKKLGISGIATNSRSWRSRGSAGNPGAQIDLLIERADRVINICEMKFAPAPFVITKDYEARLRDKMSAFTMETHNTKPLLLTMVTTFGVSRGIHSGLVSSEVLADDLFAID